MIKAAAPMAPEGGAPPTIMPTSSMLDTKTTPDLLPTNLVMGSSNEIYSATKQDTNSTPTSKAKQVTELPLRNSVRKLRVPWREGMLPTRRRWKPPN
jgi:hypothetical protein